MKRGALGLAAALAWTLLCVRWFDVAAPWRPRALQATPVWLLAILAALLVAALIHRHRRVLAPANGSAREAWLMAALAVAFRWPMAWTAAAGYTSADGSLSGVVALRVRQGLEHFVFVPNVPYSGSLKSHLAAATGLVIDLQRSFTLWSILFYGAFVAVLYALSAGVGRGRSVARRAALYAIFAPAFVTRYSLSNDGNYVEVLALGTYALLLAARSRDADDDARDVLAWAAGVALGLAFWCHILAVIHAATVGLLFAFFAPRNLPRTAPRLAAGAALGYLPGLLWNAANAWDSFRYLLPGGQSVGALDAGPSWTGRLAGMLKTQLPVLAGYDPGHTGAAAIVYGGFATAALIALGAGLVRVVARWRAERDGVRGTLLVFSAVNVLVAIVALPYIPWNARYLLFLVAPFALFLAERSETRGWRWPFAAVVAAGLLTSLAQWPAEARSDQRWRAFARDLRAAGVDRCYTDFYLAAKINFVSEEGVVCSSELGPTTTEYFSEYRRIVPAAGGAPALVAVNGAAAAKLERKLQRLGVGYRRLDLMKPTLLPERHVRPAELFAGRSD